MSEKLNEYIHINPPADLALNTCVCCGITFTQDMESVALWGQDSDDPDQDAIITGDVCPICLVSRRVAAVRAMSTALRFELEAFKARVVGDDEKACRLDFNACHYRDIAGILASPRWAIDWPDVDKWSGKRKTDKDRTYFAAKLAAAEADRRYGEGQGEKPGQLWTPPGRVLPRREVG